MQDMNNDHPLVSIALLLFGFVNYILADLTFDLAYTWIFRILSLASVISILVINRRKTIEEIKILFRKKK